MKNTTAGTSAQKTPETYEDRSARLFTDFKTRLDQCDVDPSYDLKKLSERMQADLNLADYKFKVRLADKVKWLSYGPLGISFTTCVLAIALAVFGVVQSRQRDRDTILQVRQREQDTKASLVLKVLAAPPGEGEQLLKFFEDAGLLKLEPEQQERLKELLRK